MRSVCGIVLLMIAALLVCSGKAFAANPPTKGQLWFYRIGRWIDSKEEMTLFALRSWHWQAHLTVGFRFGAGKHKIQRKLEEAGLTPEEPHCYTPRTTKLPQWITDYFYTPGF